MAFSDLLATLIVLGGVMLILRLFFKLFERRPPRSGPASSGGSPS
jgi:hypothetical protein